jgi:NADH dehydrogenase (ubiquinone) 1 beta subcomplex subunit 8
MSILRQFTRLSGPVPQLITGSKAVFVSTRNCGWTRDWKPGPPPKTKEEWAAAAKKYNLIPEDYKPYPETEGLGDYPHLQVVGQDARDPFEDFDYHYRRRNFAETLHIDYDIYTSDRHDPNEKTRIPPWKMFMMFIVSQATLVILFFAAWFFDIRIVPNMKPKQFPGPGKVHYTFEPLDH